MVEYWVSIDEQVEHDYIETGEGAYDYEWRTDYSITVRKIFSSKVEGRDIELIRDDHYTVIQLDEIKPGESCYIITVTYTDGDTFGYSTGNKKIAGVVRDSDRAREICDAIRNDEYGLKPWNGYFNGIDSVSYEPFTMGKGEHDGEG